MNRWRELKQSLDQNDDDIRSLKTSMAELDRGYTRVEAKLESQHQAIEKIGVAIDTMMSAEAEEAKRKQSIAWPLATGMLALVSVLVATSTFILGPYTDQVRANVETLTAIQQSRYTDEDAVRDTERLEAEIDAEVEDVHESIRYLQSRVDHLERRSMR